MLTSGKGSAATAAIQIPENKHDPLEGDDFLEKEVEKDDDDGILEEFEKRCEVRSTKVVSSTHVDSFVRLIKQQRLVKFQNSR